MDSTQHHAVLIRLDVIYLFMVSQLLPHFFDISTIIAKATLNYFLIGFIGELHSVTK